MALVPHCDRCDRQGQVTCVLGVDLCAACVEETKAWLTIPRSSKPLRQCGQVDREKQALGLLARRRVVSANQIAEINQEPRRTAYLGLIYLAKRGRLVHLGRGIFELAKEHSS